MRTTIALLLSLLLGSTVSRAQTLELTQPLTTVSFETGSAAVADIDREQLRAVVAWAHEHPWRLLVIESHADHVGDPSANLLLSQERADAVRSALLAHGLAAERLVSAAYGESDPAAGRYVAVRGTLGDFRAMVGGGAG